jgi:hypothetical protein
MPRATGRCRWRPKWRTSKAESERVLSAETVRQAIQRLGLGWKRAAAFLIRVNYNNRNGRSSPVRRTD